MALNPNSVSKYRLMSSFNESGHSDDFERNLVLKQAIDEFELYQKYAPNTHEVFVNDSLTPILATFIDVSDLEIRSDSKWMLTSLKHDIRMGDIITWGQRKWMCIYDKEKNTANCYKVKIQPCNYPLKMIIHSDFENKANPIVYTAHSIIMTYLTDTKEFKQPLPNATGTTFITVPFNQYTTQIIEDRRLCIYKRPFLVTGVDYTNIDYYTNYGFLKYTARPDPESSGLDDMENSICDYYRYFPKVIEPTIPDSNPISINITNTRLDRNKSIVIVASSSSGNVFNIFFDGDSNRCTLQRLSDNSYEFKTGNYTGYVNIIIEIANTSIQKKVKFLVS